MNTKKSKLTAYPWNKDSSLSICIAKDFALMSVLCFVCECVEVREGESLKYGDFHWHKPLWGSKRGRTCPVFGFRNMTINENVMVP